MPPKKKQAAPNSYFCFMTELKNTQGYKNKSMAEIAKLAAPLWANMSKAQRQPYEEMAKFEKGNRSKCTSSGKDLEMAINEEKASIERVRHMKEDIRHLISYSHSSGSLQNDVFFVIHINVFCCTNQNKWYPAEIAVAAFTLNEGVQPSEVFHEFINPGPLPLGYAAEANLHAEKTHQLKRPDFDSVSNMEEVFNKLLKFLESQSTKKDRPILYANEHHLEMIRSVLDNWSYEFDKPNLTVYELEYFFTILRNTAARSTVWHSDTFASREIEKDVNNYCSGISCDYHESASLQIHCSKSIVTRLIYVICDNCCLDMGIELIKGRHIPDDAKIAGLSKRARSTSSISSSMSSSYDSRSTLSSKTLTNEEDLEETSTVHSEKWESQSNISSMDDFPYLGAKTKKLETIPDETNVWRKVKQIHSLTQGIGNLNLPQPGLGGPSQFPPLGRGRGMLSGQGKSNVGIGRGRGNAL